MKSVEYSHLVKRKLLKLKNELIGEYGEEKTKEILTAMADHVDIDWKKVFHIVRGVSYTLGGDVIVHVEPYDIDKEEETERKFREQLKELRNKHHGI